MTPRTLSLAGCMTSDAALVRLGTWLEQIHSDQLREFETAVLTCEACDDLDLDDLDAMLEAERVFLARYRDALFVAHGVA